MSNTLLSLLFFAFFGPADDAVSVGPAPLPPSAIIAVPAGGRAAFDERDTVRRIGVTTRRVDAILAYHLDIDPDASLLVTSTVDGMPARESGVKRYDVIVSVDGTRPRSSDVLREAVQARDEVVLVVRRGAGTHEIVVPVREVEARGLFGVVLGDEEAEEVAVGAHEDARAGLEARLAEAEALRRTVGLAEVERHAARDKLRAVEAELALRAREGDGDELSVVVERLRSAAAASEQAALEEVEAELARRRATVEARRAELEALRDVLVELGEADDEEQREALEVELVKLRSAATDLEQKQELLELKSGEVLIRREAGGSALVLPSDRARLGLGRSGRGRSDDLDDVRERLDELAEMTREILEILETRSAR